MTANGSQSTHAWLPYLCLLFLGFFKCLPFRVFSLQLWNLAAFLDMLFLVIGFFSLIDEIQFMLISSVPYLHKVYTCPHKTGPTRSTLEFMNRAGVLSVWSVVISRALEQSTTINKESEKNVRMAHLDSPPHGQTS